MLVALIIGETNTLLAQSTQYFVVFEVIMTIYCVKVA